MMCFNTSQICLDIGQHKFDANIQSTQQTIMQYIIYLDDKRNNNKNVVVKLGTNLVQPKNRLW